MDLPSASVSRQSSVVRRMPRLSVWAASVTRLSGLGCCSTPKPTCGCSDPAFATLPKTYRRKKAVFPTWSSFCATLASEVKKNYHASWIVKNARRAVALAALYGTTHMRAFADVDSKAKLEAVKALITLRDEFRGIVDIQVVAFAQDGIVLQRDHLTTNGVRRIPLRPRTIFYRGKDRLLVHFHHQRAFGRGQEVKDKLLELDGVRF